MDSATGATQAEVNLRLDRTFAEVKTLGNERVAARQHP